MTFFQITTSKSKLSKQGIIQLSHHCYLWKSPGEGKMILSQDCIRQTNSWSLCWWWRWRGCSSSNKSWRSQKSGFNCKEVGFLRSFHSLFMWVSCKECLDFSLRLVHPTSNIESCSCIGVALHCNWLLIAVLRQCKRHAWKLSTVILFSILSLVI